MKRPSALKKQRQSFYNMNDDVQVDAATKSISLHPRNFNVMLRALGAQVTRENGLLNVHLSACQTSFLSPRVERIDRVIHERTYIMDGTNLAVNKRRCHDVFHEMDLSSDYTAFWCDYGNAHCVLDTSCEIKIHAIKGGKPNPRTIQLTRCLEEYKANVGTSSTPQYKPIVKCFYYVLLARSKHKKNEKYPLGLNKHIYMLCDQNVDNRHKVLDNSVVWLVRYFAKPVNGAIDERIKPYVSGFEDCIGK